MPSENKIQKYFKKARETSYLSTYHKEHIGAVLVYNHKILATGYNTNKTAPIQKEYNKERKFEEETLNNGCCHAEMMCLIKTKYLDIDWSKVKIFIYREHKKHHYPLLAKPCPACEKALKDRGINQIYYTTNYIPYIYEEI